MARGGRPSKKVVRSGPGRVQRIYPWVGFRSGFKIFPTSYGITSKKGCQFPINEILVSEYQPILRTNFFYWVAGCLHTPSKCVQSGQLTCKTMFIILGKCPVPPVTKSWKYILIWKDILICLSKTRSISKPCRDSIAPDLGFQCGASKVKNGGKLFYFEKFEFNSSHILVIWNRQKS